MTAVRFPLYDARATRALLRQLLMPPSADRRTLEKAIAQLTSGELRQLEHVADQISHACTIASTDPWTRISTGE